MRISGQYTTFNRTYTQKNNNSDVQFTGLPTILKDKVCSQFYNPLRSFKQYSPEEYARLSRFQIKVLRKRFNHLTDSYFGYFYKNTEIIHDKVSDAIKTGLDKKYGENNYNVVTIGRSLSSIGKVLGYKIGEHNVYNIPLSGAGTYKETSLVTHLDKNGILTPFKKALEDIGLSDDLIKNSKQKFVLMDFCETGDSLKGAKKIFKQIFNDSENIVTENPIQFINDRNLKDAYLITMKGSMYKQFSFVERAHNLVNTDCARINPQKADYETKLVWFKLLDNTVTKTEQSTSALSTTTGDLLQREF